MSSAKLPRDKCTRRNPSLGPGIWQDTGWPVKAANRRPMTSRMLKTAAALVLGFVLAWQGVFTVSAGVGSSARPRKSDCCCAGCDFKHCSTPVCCARPPDKPAPFAPAAVPPPFSHERQALAAPVTASLSLPFHQPDEPSAVPSSRARFAAVPIFQRDCSYLI